MNPPSHRRASQRAACVATLLALSGWIGCSLNTHGDAEDSAGSSPDASAGAAGSKPDGGGGAYGGSGGSAGKAGSSGKGGAGGAAGSATGGAGGSTTGGAGGATGGAGGTGGAPGPEQCTNGVDDNSDGLIDCADPQCNPDYWCVPESSPGWGPITFLGKHAPNEPAKDCGPYTANPAALHHGVDIPTDGCSCACGAPTGGMCTGGAGLWQTGACGGGFAQATPGCFDFHTAGWTIGGVRTSTVSLTTAGTCSPSVSGAPQAASWVATIDRCAVSSPGAGCGAGQVCVPRPPSSLGAQACLERSGIEACPVGYPQQQILYETIEDTRTCSATGCSCSEASGQSCDFSLALYTDATCSTTPAGTYPLDGACHATGFPQYYIGSSAFVGSIKGGACAPSGGPSIAGDVTPTGPHSVCCAP